MKPDPIFMLDANPVSIEQVQSDEMELLQNMCSHSNLYTCASEVRGSYATLHALHEMGQMNKDFIEARFDKVMNLPQMTRPVMKRVSEAHGWIDCSHGLI